MAFEEQNQQWLQLIQSDKGLRRRKRFHEPLAQTLAQNLSPEEFQCLPRSGENEGLKTTMRILSGIVHDNAINAGLTEYRSGLQNAALVTIYLQDMAHFAIMNRIYARFFPPRRPAARLCVQLNLENGAAFCLSVLIPTLGEVCKCDKLCRF